MNKIYDKFTENSFKRLTILLCFLGDLFIISYIWNTYKNYDYFLKLFNFYKKSLALQIGPEKAASIRFTDSFLKEVYQLMVMNLAYMLFFVLIFHIVIYVLHYKNKKYPHNYINLMVWVAGPGCFLIMLGNNASAIYQAGLFVLGCIYMYIAFGLKEFPFKKNAQLKN